ncbi:MAG: DUF1292 domain-containing protein [Clostridia bacterium]|nr:DUF1292 domain-containing protein [Clostridia bacterium]
MAKNNKKKDNKEEELSTTVVLCDEEGNEVEFHVLDIVELNETDYAVLLPVVPDEETEGNVVILKVETIDEDSMEETFVGIDDDETINAVFEIFKAKLEAEFGK